MMKNIFKFLLCLCFFTSVAYNTLEAQNQRPMNLPQYDNELYHYGFILGYNQLLPTIDFIDNFQNVIHNSGELPSNDKLTGTNDDFLSSDFKVKDIAPRMSHGFTVGIVGNLRLAKYFDLRLIPSLSFVERKIVYQIASQQIGPDNETIEIFKDIKSHTSSTLIELPLQIKYKSKRYNNSAAYIIAGANYKIDIASKKKNYETDNNQSNSKPKNLDTKRQDIAAEIGAGFDFYTGYFKLGIELKMSYGLLDVAKYDNYMFTSSFDNLRNKMFQLSFTFE